MEQFFTVQQIASLLGVHSLTVRRYIKSGKLHAVRIGGTIRIPASSVHGFKGVTLPSSWQSLTQNRGNLDKIFSLHDPLFVLEGSGHSTIISRFLTIIRSTLQHTSEA